MVIFDLKNFCEVKGFEMEGLLPTDTLDAEHRFIKLAVSAIEHIVERFSASGEINIQIIEQIVDFMRSYADQCHHGKEEDLLFPALIELGVPEQGCPVGALKGEHIRGRSYVANLIEGLELVKANDERGYEQIKKGLEGIVKLYPNHIWKEDFLLFPMTEKIMNEETLINLKEKFSRFDETFGVEKIKFYESFARDISGAAD